MSVLLGRLCPNFTPRVVGGAKTYPSAKLDPTHKGIGHTSDMWYAVYLVPYIYQLYLFSDVCQSTLFTQCWFCSTCGRELCGLCVRERKVNHFRLREISTQRFLLFIFQPNTPAAPCSFHCLLPISRFEDQELDDLIQVMESCLIRYEFSTCPLYAWIMHRLTQGYKFSARP